LSKVKITDERVFARFSGTSSVLFAVLSGLLIFVEIPDTWKLITGIGALATLFALYLVTWLRSNNLNHVKLKIDGSTVHIKVGDIFSQPGLKAIAFNEFFDTLVDNRIIARESVNGVFIDRHLRRPVSELDAHIDSYPFEHEDLCRVAADRRHGKQQRYKLGTICVYDDYLLTAFTKFDVHDQATLTMPEYLEFLINFWDKVNRVYAQQSVSTTIFGSGITRIKGHKNISDEELLKIMLWTFRISEMRFKHPAKLTVVIHESKIDQINLFDIQAVRNGI
jgi:hypothetical protein